MKNIQKKDETKKVVVCGKAFIDHIKAVDDFFDNDRKLEVKKSLTDIGGLAPCIALFLAEAGCPVHYYGSWGNDKWGHLIENRLKKSRLSFEVRYLKKTPANLVILSEKNGERLIIKDHVSINTDSTGGTKRIFSPYFQNGQIFVFDRYNLQIFKDFLGSKRRDQVSLVDTSTNYTNQTAFLFKNADYPIVPYKFVVNASSNNNFLSGLKTLKSIRSRDFVITLGSKGCLQVANQLSIYFPPYKINALDSLGAGDAFRAGFSLGLSLNLENNKIFSLANAAGALQCQRIGNLGALPSIDEINFLTTTQKFSYWPMEINAFTSLCSPEPI